MRANQTCAYIKVDRCPLAVVDHDSNSNLSVHGWNAIVIVFCSPISLDSVYAKNNHVSMPNNGNNIPADHAIYPKNPGMRTPLLSAMERTIKFGALPI